MEDCIFQEEIIEDILIRLPMKPLVQCKCVSKSWNTLISQPYFKKMYHNSHNFPKMLFGQNSPKDNNAFYFFTSSLSYDVQLVEDIRRLDWPSNSNPQYGGKVYCCYDGLFLIGISRDEDEEEEVSQPPIVFLWNPSTGESIILPDSEFPVIDDECYAYGLGYDSTSDDYKVFRFNWDEGNNHEILALKSGSWRRTMEDNTSASISERDRTLAFVHGAFHWLGWSRSLLCVVTFDISKEVYGEIPVPRAVAQDEAVVSVLGGMLCVYHNDSVTFNVWVMNEYGVKESWTRSFSIPSSDFSFIKPIFRFSDGELLLLAENEVSGAIEYGLWKVITISMHFHSWMVLFIQKA